jgi:hypothetical protein
MFTIGAFFLIAAIGWYIGRANVKDRQIIAIVSDEELRTAILHARQDLKLIAFLLGGILLALGVVADRIH